MIAPLIILIATCRRASADKIAETDESILFIAHDPNGGRSHLAPQHYSDFDHLVGTVTTGGAKCGEGLLRAIVENHHVFTKRLHYSDRVLIHRINITANRKSYYYNKDRTLKPFKSVVWARKHLGDGDDAGRYLLPPGTQVMVDVDGTGAHWAHGSIVRIDNPESPPATKEYTPPFTYTVKFKTGVHELPKAVRESEELITKYFVGLPQIPLARLRLQTYTETLTMLKDVYKDMVSLRVEFVHSAGHLIFCSGRAPRLTIAIRRCLFLSQVLALVHAALAIAKGLGVPALISEGSVLGSMRHHACQGFCRTLFLSMLHWPAMVRILICVRSALQMFDRTLPLGTTTWTCRCFSRTGSRARATSAATRTRSSAGCTTRSSTTSTRPCTRGSGAWGRRPKTVCRGAIIA